MTGGRDKNGCGSGIFGDGRGNITGGQGYTVEKIGRWVTGGNRCDTCILGDECNS